MWRSTAANRRRIATAYAWSVLVWTAYAVLMMAMSIGGIVDVRMRGIALPILPWIAFSVVYHYQWALVTPALVWFSLRFPVDRKNWLRAIPLHLACAAAVAAVYLWPRHAVRTFTTVAWGYPPRLPAGDLPYFSSLFFDNVFMVVQVLVAGQLIGVHRAVIDRERRASELNTRLAQAQLQSLKAQIRPHFLFNTLHAVATLMQRDVAGARRMIALLADLLRGSLDADGRQTVSLAEELHVASRYLDIERTRFADRLTIVTNVPYEVLCASVPSFLLQPLLENAFAHGIARRAGPGHVALRAWKHGDQLRVELQDNGPGLPPDGITEGLGLGNTRARLAHLYGERASLELANAPDAGCVLRLTLPFETASLPCEYAR